jgi:outer membrane protein assembly factor BamD
MSKFRVRDATIRRARRMLAVVGLCLAASACSLFGGGDEPQYVERPVEDLYNNAMDSLLIGDFLEAARLFDEVERQHPYSSWAAKAQLMAAFANYQNNRYDEAVNALDRFIQLHPANKDIAYAHYLRSISYYEQISDVGRDQTKTRLALESLEEVVRRFPESRYSRDATLKLDLARDHLAGKHMDIGRFYLGKGEYLAAINRFRMVIQDYQTTTHVPEALHRLVESYLVLGVTDEAQATAAVLGHNYPGSPWYADSYVLLTGIDLRPEEYQGSWIARVWKSLI